MKWQFQVTVLLNYLGMLLAMAAAAVSVTALAAWGFHKLEERAPGGRGYVRVRQHVH